eukprot:TRINITY_DN19614_c0_g1_i1.p1 TRINITY_DN19614_c0_g1~~TRINITY_DN19614_c0_g1_i1.p1  ORF type:complete len:480 (-),score=70.47 TRINITY_DN19614_c0_g1_i1:7-1446(-)
MGLPEEEFVADSDTLSDTIKCSLCLSVFADPVSAFGRPCHCTFCRSCIAGWLDTETSCPNDRQPLRMDMMTPDIKVQSFLDEQHVFCRCRAAGCFWTGRYDARPGHEEACLATQVSSLQRRAEEDKGIIAALIGQKRLVQEQNIIIAALTEQLEMKERENEQLRDRIKGLNGFQAWLSKSLSSAPEDVRELLQSCMSAVDDPCSSKKHAAGSPGSSQDAPKNQKASKERIARDYQIGSPDFTRTAQKTQKAPKQGMRQKESPEEREEIEREDHWEEYWGYEECWEGTKLEQVIEEGCKCGVDIDSMADMDRQFFCCAVEEPEGDLGLLVESMNAMNMTCAPSGEERAGGTGHLGKMIFSDSLEQLAIVAYVPAEKRARCSCEEWLKTALGIFSGEIQSITSDVCTGVVKTSLRKGKKVEMRYQMILEANKYLCERGLGRICMSTELDYHVIEDMPIALACRLGELTIGQIGRASGRERV